jgi:hypothetical protein
MQTAKAEIEVTEEIEPKNVIRIEDWFSSARHQKRLKARETEEKKGELTSLDEWKKKMG